MDKMPTVIMIAAVGQAANGKKIIGDDAKLPWHLPRDLRFFRRLTLGHTVVMGRKTFESFGKRPLPKRNNIVISRNKEYVAEGCKVFHSIQDAINNVSGEERIFIIGGGEIYTQSMKFADQIILTEIIDQNKNDNLFPLFYGNVFFPEIGEDWKIVKPGKQLFLASNKFPITQKKQKVAERALYFRVVWYKRKK
ncbi:dihydrofolate reductase [mine drainage metagenome]|uniref:dihydrofolate reductase n=1 Tax=mine drainage metagenome TaxID=410659 RepID=A0A1J5SA74_9ZZZZ